MGIKITPPLIVLAISVLTLIVYACQKNEDSLNYEISDTISLAKAQFQKDSIATQGFVQDTNGLTRKILWNQARSGKDNSLLVPVYHYAGRNKVIRIGEDNISLNGNVWLYVHKQEGKYSFTLWTLIPEKGNKSKGFTGTLLSEDYFMPEVSYTHYEDGIVVNDVKWNTINKRQAARRQTTQGLKADMGDGWDCNTITTAVCVGKMVGSSEIETCTYRVKTTCKRQRTNPGFGDNQEHISWIDCDPLEGGCGTGVYEEIEEYEEEYEIIDSLQAYKCVMDIILALESHSSFRSLLDPFRDSGSPNLVFKHSTEQMHWSDSLGLYSFAYLDPSLSPGTMNIVFNTNALNNTSELMVAATVIHEVVHAYIFYHLESLSGGKVNTPGPYWLTSAFVLSDSLDYHSLNPNYHQHLLMMTRQNVFYVMQTALKVWGGNSYSDDEYLMATMNGLNNAGNLSGQNVSQAHINRVDSTFNGLLGKLKLTEEDFNAFIIKQNTDSTRIKIACAK